VSMWTARPVPCNPCWWYPENPRPSQTSVLTGLPVLPAVLPTNSCWQRRFSPVLSHTFYEYVQVPLKCPLPPVQKSACDKPFHIEIYGSASPDLPFPGVLFY